MSWTPLWTAHIIENNICLGTGFNFAYIIQPQSLGAIFCTHTQSLSSIYSQRIQLLYLVQHSSQTNLLQHIQIVIAGSSISTKSNLYPLSQKPRHWSYTTGQLHIGAWIMHWCYLMLLHNGQILIIQPYAMSGNGWTLE